MHEFSLIQALLTQLETVVAENNSRRISKVVVQIGDLRQCVPEILEFAFINLALGTKAEGAQLVLEHIPVRAECKVCHREFVVQKKIFMCPHCQSTQLQLLSGKEFVLKAVELEILCK